MLSPIDSMARLSYAVVETAAEAGAPKIIVYNDLEHSTFRVAYVDNRRPFIVGDYATLEEANTQFPAAFRKLCATSPGLRPVASWYKDAVLMLMHIDIAHQYRSSLVRGPTRSVGYTLVYIDSIWRLSTATEIWVDTLSSLL